MIEVHYDRTPNCWKVIIALEEVRLPYSIVRYNLFRGDHLTPEFRKISPNLRVPAIVIGEKDSPDRTCIFESGAILLHIAELSGKLLPADGPARANVLKWLFWQVAGLGPMMGQASYFLRYARTRSEDAIERYTKEMRRLIKVLEYRLAEAEYLGGSEYSIADIAAWPLMSNVHLVGIEKTDFPYTAAWLDRIGDRDAVKRAFARPETAVDPTYLEQRRELTDEEYANVYGERMLKAVEAR